MIILFFNSSKSYKTSIRHSNIDLFSSSEHAEKKLSFFFSKCINDHILNENNKQSVSYSSMKDSEF